MAKMNYLISIIAYLCVFGNLHVPPVQARPTLLNYGLDHRDILLARDSDDVSSQSFKLRVPITFYGQQYTSIYINQNGLVSFDTPIFQFINIQFPLDYPNIAPFYSDVDTRIQGSVYYREAQQPELLGAVSQILFENFGSAEFFKPTSLVIVTWDSVGYFDRKSDKYLARNSSIPSLIQQQKLRFMEQNRKTNTYQLVIASNGQDSYALFLYDKIEWIHGTGKNPSLPDAKAQAGFTSAVGQHYAIRGSGTDQMSNLHKRSNSDTVGLWAFRIGRIQDAVEEPDRKVGLDESAENGSSCSVGFTECHSQAQCVDYNPGFCCRCVAGFMGNGKVCLQDTIPQRVTGKVKGVLNGHAIDDSDLFSYILPGDGRSYTAISKIPPRLGPDIQTLTVFGTIIGWLFSIQVKGAPNGFQLTGGVFNYTAEVSFGQSGQKVQVTQMYTGLDVFSHLKADTRLYGNTPSVPAGVAIEIGDYEMQMTRVAAGQIRSTSSHTYKIEGTSEEFPFSLEQTITYDECTAHPPMPAELETTRMKVGRNYVAYDAGQEIARYAITSKVTPLEGEDPCKDNRDKCGPHSTCVANDDSYKCICELGYEERYNELGVAECTDIDECRSGRHTCDATAICMNVPGSFHCQCRPSYQGDGHTCNKILSCADVNCNPNAQCTEVAVGVPECRCIAGYYGDGIYCVQQIGREIEAGQAPDCLQVSICDPLFALCVYSPSSRSNVCQCRPGYSGDGIRCMRETSENSESCFFENNCDQNAACTEDASGQHHCVCRRGFVGDGYTCQRERDAVYPTPKCLASYCWCPSGYIYDDIRSECQPDDGAGEQLPPDFDFESNPVPIPVDNSCYNNPGLCDQNAACLPRTGGGGVVAYECQCNPGFRGDGRQCVVESQCRSHEECGTYGMCALDPVTQRAYVCKCREGFVGTNGLDCQPGPDAGCDLTRNCHVNADCKWSHESSKYNCECKPGFLGDGVNGCNEDLLGCNILRNCSPKGTCEYDVRARGYRCKCNEGFEGDGISCKTTRSCYEDRTVCDTNADCTPNPTTREYACVCRTGYRGDGQECRQILPRDTQFLLVAKGMSIFKVPVNGDTPEPLYIDPSQTAIGLDKDCANEKMYWSDVANQVIKEGFFNGSGSSSVVISDVGSPEGLAFDASSQNLYWTDSSKDTIEVANLVSKKRKTLIDTGLVNPRGIAVYSRRGRLYWSDWNRAHPKIEFSGLDGIGRQTLVGEGLSLPNSLVIDETADQLCWADAGNNNIECVGIDGRNRQIILARILYPFGLVLDSDTFYWTDWNTTKIESTIRGTGQRGHSLSVSIGGPGKLYGLVLVPTICYPEHSPCFYSQCTEQQICLPNIRGARSCRCVDNSTDSGCVDTF